MTELPDRPLSKDELRAALSIPYVGAKLGVLFSSEGTALCPFHADTSPSLYLWDGDDEVRRWWCQPCGFGGDVFDLIQRVEGLTFPQALERAAELLGELPPGYQPPAPVRQSRTSGPGDWTHTVTEARERAARPDHAGILALRVGLASADDPILAARWDTYLRGTWGWGIDAAGSVLLPHWDAEFNLTGCKVRTGSGKVSMPGSKYVAPYGAWLGRRHADVLITEGETDAVWAGFAAGELGLALDVFALPSGAGGDPDPAWLDFLAQPRVLYLAFDPDAAGVAATRRWVSFLAERGHRGAVRICSLPLGRDLRAANPNLRSLLASARSPIAEPEDFAAQPGGYVRVDRNGNPRAVTTWTVEPVAQLVGGEPGYDVTFSQQGVSTVDVLLASDLASLAALRRWCTRRGTFFTGGDGDLQRLAEWVEARGSCLPQVFQTSQVGLHAPPSEYAFAGPSVAYPGGYYGDLPWWYTTASLAADVSDRLYLPGDGEPFIWSWLEAFLELSSPSVTHPLLAWLVAAARRPEALEFPILFIGGSSGVGKSTLAQLGCRLLGSRIELSLGANTPFILLRTLASSTSFPVFVDEWTRLSRRDVREALQGAIPDLYVRGLTERGQADLRAAAYPMTAPTIIAGEDTFTLDRELERLICLSPARATQNYAALERVQTVPLERFGALLHRWLSGPREHELPTMRPPAATRPARNREILRAGWTTLRLLLDDAAQRWDSVPELPDEPDLSCLTPPSEAETENVYELALAEVYPLRDSGGLPVAWPDQGGRGTWVRFNAVLALLETRRFDLELPGRSRAMMAYFRERYGDLELGARVTPPGAFQAVRAHLIPGLNLGDPDPREGWTGD